MSSCLTSEQRKKIEENRRIALEKRAVKLNSAKIVGSGFNKDITSAALASNEFVNNKSSKTFFNNSFKNPSKASNFKSFSHQSVSSSSVSSNVWNVSSEILSANVRLISRDRFAVDVGFNNKVIEFFKTITGKQYGWY